MDAEQLLIIDPQNDFTEPSGSLFVRGADADMDRLSRFVERRAGMLGQVHVTMDMHHQMQIFHPLFWRDADGNPPPPFTRIAAGEVAAGKWIPRGATSLQRALAYTSALEKNGRFALVIWPNHCLEGSWGAQIHGGLFSRLCQWEGQALGRIDFIRKGDNPFTEHYSALRAEVADPNDPASAMNDKLVRLLSGAGTVYVAGEALDYCVYNTVMDLAGSQGIDAAHIVVLEDCTSPIDPASSARIRAEFSGLGIRFARSTEVR